MRPQDRYIEQGAIAERQKGSTTLSYIEGHRVIQNLNELYPDQWTFVIDHFEHIYCKSITKINKESKTSKEGFEVGAFCRGTLHLGKFSFSDIGYGSGTDYNNALTAYESAGKEAVTDSLKRCAKNLGNYFGLALYDKTQEAVLDHSIQGWQKLLNMALVNVSQKLVDEMNLHRVQIKEKYKILNTNDMTPAIWRELLGYCWELYWDSFNNITQTNEHN